jgi:hypothetical protein
LGFGEHVQSITLNKESASAVEPQQVETVEVEGLQFATEADEERAAIQEEGQKNEN